MTYQFLKLNQNEKTLEIVIARPEVYNALNKDAKKEIIRAIKEANSNDQIRSIILTAEGKAFCSGQDLNDRTIQADTGPVDLGKTLETEWNPLVSSIRESDKPVIACVNGTCAGAGISVAMACDLIVAKTGTKFISGFTKLGLIPDAGSSHRFSHALGMQRAFEFFTFNQPLDHQTMIDCGLINASVDDPIEQARTWALQINQLAPLSLAYLKKNLQKGLDLTYNETLEREISCQRMLGNSQDYQEGLKSFFEKRTPHFTGK